jgi:hypothetical protein
MNRMIILFLHDKIIQFIQQEPLAQVFVESLEVTVITWIKVGNPLHGLDA